MDFPQLRTNPSKQGILNGAGEIIDLDSCRVNLAASAACNDDWQVLVATPGNHCHFCPDLIDGIDHEIEATIQKRSHVFRRHEILNFGQLALRIDSANTRSHRCYLRLAKSFFERVNLSVSVGFRDVVEIDQRNRSDTATC